MKDKQVNLLTIDLVAGTRVALGIGIGLLAADHFLPEHRRMIGLTLFGIGVLTTLPLLAEVLGAPDVPKADGLRVQRNPISPYVTADGEGGAS